MKRELRDKWVEALRSGKYVQGKSRLRTHFDGFCCLGVFCDVVDPEGWKNTDHDGWQHWGESYSLHGEMRKLSGVPEDYDTKATQITKLIYLNDSTGFSFLEIADWIERYFPVED